ncbi:hypothetical protein GUITHDRAFT_121139 [Guillardia theta CCMP2712]|uniref:Major facilitator superfamily (MFS) profile domain-containing protein n=1 Tax=Guillardia theta (strain CCMP2712) TaxID=905079 RepID=L1I9X3_GUITC|nr:hypothetical protein GUITHDRAFT_121139 [Guillardia theta CCMP2712]EKX32699.1 hypothetical protein GUITHDRAFT_121139 [Guillardia theta CCMP2712]|eukprot:XP_005819679.1 hypothetical protein GUITHDRAFT_121139 [Guillardia theta CCMP2712]
MRSGRLVEAGTEEGILNMRGGKPSAEENLAGQGSPCGLTWPITTCWMYFMSIALCAPALPSMANKIARSDGKGTVSAEGVRLYGTLTSIDQAFTVLFTKLWGSYSDVIGRKPLMLFSAAGLAVGWATVVKAAENKNMALLYFGRMLDGITSCMQPICQSAVQDVSAPEQLKANFGILLGLAVGGAFILGAMMGGIITSIKGPELVMATASLVSAVNFFVTLFFAPETLPPHKRMAKVQWKEANPFGAMEILTRDLVTAGAAASYLLIWTALNGQQTNLFSYVEYRYGWDRTRGAMLQAQVGLVLALSQSLAPKYLSPYLSTSNIIQLGLFLYLVSGIIMGLAPNGLVFTGGALLSAVGCMAIPVLMSVVASRAPPGKSGAMLSALETGLTLDRVLAFKSMASLFAWGMKKSIPGVFHYVGSTCCLLAMLVMTMISKEVDR